MDWTSQMHKSSMPAALAAAFCAALCTRAWTAAIALAAVQLVAYAAAAMCARPAKYPWPTGTRRSGAIRRWMLSGLCGGGVGACVLMAMDVLLRRRFGVEMLPLCALVGALCARSCAAARLNRRIWRPVASLAGTAVVVAGVSVCLYPLL